VQAESILALAVVLTGASEALRLRQLRKCSMRGPPEDGWKPIESAPFDVEVSLQVTDGRGSPYTIK
jgi:hypothetical protein